MWVEFVVGSLPCSERFFSGYSGFPLSLKTNTSKFQFDLERTDMFKSSYELLSAWWVKKQFTIYNYGCVEEYGNRKVKTPKPHSSVEEHKWQQNSFINK